MTDTLAVFHHDERVGLLTQRAGDRFTFTYDPEWLSSPHRFAVSVSLPLQETPYGTDAAHFFFSNLLPVADLRRTLCQRLGISVDNDFELLNAIGGECAGALTLISEQGKRAPAADQYRPLTAKELEVLAASQVLPALDGKAGLRLSLAGAQDKLPVKILDGSLLLPLGSSPSTHILKFPNRHYKHLPANEVLTSMIAQGLNLLRWLAFNVLVFNGDAHAKNVSILYSGSQRLLAPFYDLVCTRAYPHLSPGLAMAVGNEFDPTLVRRAHWKRLAEELELGSRFVLSTVREVAERFPDAVTDAAAEFRQRYGRSPALQLILPRIRRQARRVAALLA